MEVHWTSEAERDYVQIINYLSDKWTSKEVLTFTKKVNLIVEMLQQYPKIGNALDKYPNVRRTVIVEQVSLFYRLEGDSLNILKLWNNMQDPTRFNV